MQFLWLALMVVFLATEAGTVTLISAWFAAGALAALIAAFLGAEIWLQVTVFFVVSVALLICLRPLARKYLKPRIVRTNVDSLIGSEGYVTADIDNIVVALDENNENTLKTYAGIDEESQCAILRYENKKAYPDKTIKVKKLVVQGVAKHIIKAL